MKLIIAGGRDYLLTDDDGYKLHLMALRMTIDEVVSGGARGVDRCGEEWARRMNIPVKIFKADWKKHGKAAGPIRNRQMAAYADAVALFPGGAGTKNMKREALNAKLDIFDYSQKGE